jgi:microsomal epoxide hydrolase
LALLMSVAALAQPVTERDRFFLTSDNVRLHLAEAGPATGHTILFIPGLAMPGWIWERQMQVFGRRYHVVALDPRGQGRSDVPAIGYEPIRRGEDIAETIAHLEPVPVTVVAWSLGVLDTLAYLHMHGDALVAGLVLVDNSVGEDPAPLLLHQAVRPGPQLSYAAGMRLFVHSLFRQPQRAAWLDRLTRASMSLPEAASHSLRAYPLPRTYWKEAVYATVRPVLYVVRPRWAAQAENLARNRPGTEIAIFANAGHALFVDDPNRFDTLLEGFLHRRVWP